MARQRSKRATGGRGSAEAIAKRRAARQLNALLTGGAEHGARLDGRTEKRRQRLLRELKEGRGGKELKPIDFVTRVNELFGLGETISSLRKHGIKPRRAEPTPELMATVRKAQEAYGFLPNAWRMLGVALDENETAKSRRPKKTAKRRRVS